MNGSGTSPRSRIQKTDIQSAECLGSIPLSCSQMKTCSARMEAEKLSVGDDLVLFGSDVRVGA